MAGGSGRAQWTVLQTGFGQGGAFLAAWQAWRVNRQRPGMLHFCALSEAPCTVQALTEAGASSSGTAALVQQLAAQWFGLLPGFHRLVFEGGRVLLTLCIGETRALLRQQDFEADVVLLDHAGGCDLHLLKSVARLCRRGSRLFTPDARTVSAAALAQCGFVDEAPGEPRGELQAPAALQARFDPAWEPRGQRPQAASVAGECVVIGGGLAGAAAAHSLALRGWQVLVLDAAVAPAAGASSLPAGLLAPHQSPDDSLLSRLTRSGVRLALQQASELLDEGTDWSASGVLEHRHDALAALPTPPPAALRPWSQAATSEQKLSAGLPTTAPALWHARAGWIKPGALVRAWLGIPGITWRGGQKVERIQPTADGWRCVDSEGATLAQGALVVVAAAHASARLLPCPVTLQPVRGQVSWAHQDPVISLPPFPVNGQGHFLPGVPLGGGAAWLCGSTFDRDDSDATARAADDTRNLAQLGKLLPELGGRLACSLMPGELRSWSAVRCVSADRRPLVGEVAPGLWLSTAMGSRGLTFAALCAELMAARLHAEPLPLPRKLADALDVRRQMAPQATSRAYPA